MRREGYIIEEIIEYSICRRHSIRYFVEPIVRGQGRDDSCLPIGEKIITELTASIADGSFRLGGYHERKLKNTVKTYFADPVHERPHRCVCHHECGGPPPAKRYIRTTGASIKRRGTHDLMNCIRTDLQKIRKARFTHTNLTSGGFMTMRGRTLLCGASGGCSRTKGCWSCWSGLLSCCRKVSVSDCAVHKGAGKSASVCIFRPLSEG